VTITKAKARRRRRSPEDARQNALKAARVLLLESGPSAITLKAVANRLGMAHGSIAHHFGSAAGLQSALADQMTRDLVATVEDAVIKLRQGTSSRGDVVDLVFEEFGSGGSGQLIAWLASSGHRDQLRPLCETISDLAAMLRKGKSGASKQDAGLAILLVMLPALGYALIGSPLSEALSIDQNVYRKMIADQLGDHRRRRTNR